MTSLGRRPLLKGAGVALAGLGGLAGSAAARKGGSLRGATPLTDRAADILVFWSEVDDGNTSPDNPSDFGFSPSPTFDPSPPGGLTFAGNDPAGGGLFDFGRIVMRPNGDLVNTAWLLLGGAVIADEEYSSYKLKHLGDGMYRSRAQQMKFQARPATAIHGILNSNVPGGVPFLPIFDRLGGKRWFAIGDEYAQLELDGDGNPDPSKPTWAATRIDLYERPRMEFGLSLLYVIGADDNATPVPDNIPLAALGTAGQLIGNGRAIPGSG